MTRFKCLYCAKDYHEKEKLQKHSEATHFQFRVLCNLCGNFVASKKTLMIHKGLFHKPRKPIQKQKAPKQKKSGQKSQYNNQKQKPAE